LDRLVVTGTLTEVANPEEMSAILYREGFQCFASGSLPNRCASTSAITRWNRSGKRWSEEKICHKKPCKESDFPVS
jgi:hypothetical protein